MPSSPVSLMKVTLPEMSMKSDAVVTIGALLNTRTRPAGSTTTQRVPSPGACSMATGLESATPENTCSVPIVGPFGGNGIGVGGPPPLNDPPPLPPQPQRTSAPLSAAIHRPRVKLVIG